MEPTVTYLVVGDCGSYYCNSFHPIAVREGEADAEYAANEARKVKGVWGGPLWAEVAVLPLVDEELTDKYRDGCH